MPSYIRDTDILDQYIQNNEANDVLNEILDLKF